MSRLEIAELAQLQRQRDRQFPVPIDAMDQHELAAFMAYHCNGASMRLAELRARSRSAEEIAEQRAMAVAIESMSADVLAEFMAEMAAICSPKGTGSCP